MKIAGMIRTLIFLMGLLLSCNREDNKHGKMKTYIINKTVEINADALSVWDALTNPEKTKQYFFNCEVFSDWKEGSPITFKGRVFLVKKIEFKGTIISIKEGEWLKYTLKNEDDDHPSESTVTLELKQERGKTMLNVTDDVGQGEGAEERYSRSLKGWDKVLQGLKDMVEEENVRTQS